MGARNEKAKQLKTIKTKGFIESPKLPKKFESLANQLIEGSVLETVAQKMLKDERTNPTKIVDKIAELMNSDDARLIRAKGNFLLEITKITDLNIMALEKKVAPKKEPTKQTEYETVETKTNDKPSSIDDL
jgi:hypothetical protein